MAFTVYDTRGRIKSVTSNGWTEFSFTTTGNIDNLDFGNASLIRANNAADATIRGLLAGTAGQVVFIESIGAGNLLLAHQNGSSSAANRLINDVTSASTPLAAGKGYAAYIYDGTTARWRLCCHDQGGYITPTYAAGNFTGSGTIVWTVDAGDVTAYQYRVIGKALHIILSIQTTSVAGAGIELRIAIPGSFTPISGARYLVYIQNNGVVATGVLDETGGTVMRCFCDLTGATNWTVTAANNTYIIGQLFMEIT